MVCGVHTRLLRQGNGVGANKWILGGQHTDKERRKTVWPSSRCLPLIRALENSLPNIKNGRNTQHGPVIAYADDVTVFVTNPGDFHAIQQAIHLHEGATGARLNPRKSKALGIGAWKEPPTALDIFFHERVNILGVKFSPKIATSIR